MSNGIKGVDVVDEGVCAPTESGGHFLPPADNTYDLGSVAKSWRNLHVQTAVYATSVAGSWSPSDDDTYWLGTATLGWKGLHMPDTLITDESGHVLLRNNANNAYVGLKAGAAEFNGIATFKSDVVNEGYLGLLVTDTDGATEGEIWYDASENTIKVCTGSVDSVVLLAATQALTNKTLDAAVAKGTWTASGTWTLPAITAGGIISIADTKAINTGIVNDDYFTIGAVDNDTNTITELVRFVGASTPYTLFGTDINIAANKLQTTTLYLYEAANTYLGVKRISDNAWMGLQVNDLRFTNVIDPQADGAVIQAGTSTDWYLLFRAYDTGVGQIEVARLAGAADPYFAMGGSQEFKFYESGTALFGGVVTSDAATMEIGAAGVIKSGATNTDTMLLAANDTTFITFLTADTDVCTIEAITMKGTWLADGTVTLPAITLGGTVTLADIGVQLNESLGTDNHFSGMTRAAVAGCTTNFGDILYLATADDRWELAQADDDTTHGGNSLLAINVTTAEKGDGEAFVVLLIGFVRDDSAYEFVNGGTPVYLSAGTAGLITATPPAGNGNIVRVVGYADDDKETIFFNPDGAWVEVVV